MLPLSSAAITALSGCNAADGTAFVNSAALRDFRFNTNQIVFSTPMRRRDYFFGPLHRRRLVSTIPMLGVSVGILAAKYMPWADPDRWERVNWAAHLHAIYVFALPNALIMAAILFAIAVMARNEVIPFIGALVLLIRIYCGRRSAAGPAA